MLPPKHGEPWSLSDLNYLENAHERDYSYEAIAVVLGRTPHAIHCKLKELMLNTDTPTETKKETKMSNNKVTFHKKVGNTPVENLEVEDILTRIEQEESYIARLTNFKLTSNAIKKLITQHTNNIEELHIILNEKVNG